MTIATEGLMLFCIFTTIIVGLTALIAGGFFERDWLTVLFGIIFLIAGLTASLKLFADTKKENYIGAEPFACNQTQTVFTTDEGTYLADGLYPDGAYLLTVDGKDVLVVWQAVDGEVG